MKLPAARCPGRFCFQRRTSASRRQAPRAVAVVRAHPVVERRLAGRHGVFDGVDDLRRFREVAQEVVAGQLRVGSPLAFRQARLTRTSTWSFPQASDCDAGGRGQAGNGGQWRPVLPLASRNHDHPMPRMQDREHRRGHELREVRRVPWPKAGRRVARPGACGCQEETGCRRRCDGRGFHRLRDLPGGSRASVFPASSGD